MRIGNIEITFGTWLGSKWTMYATRLLILLMPFAGAAFYAAWSSVQSAAVTEVAAAKAEIVSIKSTLGDRANDSEAFQVEVRKAIGGVNESLKEVDGKLFATQVDVGVIKRLVTELRNQQVADAKLDPANFDSEPVMLASVPRVIPPPEPFPAIGR